MIQPVRCPPHVRRQLLIRFLADDRLAALVQVLETGVNPLGFFLAKRSNAQMDGFPFLLFLSFLQRL